MTYNNCFVNVVIKINCSSPKSEFCDFLKALAQNTKTTFFKYRFLMIKHRLNTVKHHLLVEKDRGNACRKYQEKKTSRFFLANFFRGLSFYGAGCKYAGTKRKEGSVFYENYSIRTLIFSVFVFVPYI
jgi:hypothetical protein